MWLLALFACSDPAPIAPIAPIAPVHPSHAEHMAKMEKTRDQLKSDLGPAYDAPVPGLDAADPANGQVLYNKACALCHGPGGKGDGPSGSGLEPPPADLTDGFHARYYSDAGRIRIIERGSPGTAMPAFTERFDHGAILDLYAYVAKFRDGSFDGHTNHVH